MPDSQDASGRLADLRRHGMLVAVDGEPACQHAVDWAAYIARDAGCHVHVVSVGSAEPVPRRAADGRLLGTEASSVPRSAVDAALARLQAAGVQAHGHVATGEPGLTILAHAARLGVPLLVLGAHNPGRAAPTLGSVAARILASAPADVLLARAPPPPGAVLAATDGSPAAERAVALALAIARAVHAPAAVVQVFPRLDSRGVKGAALALREDLPPDVERRVRLGPTVETLLDEQPPHSRDLLVLGHRGYGGQTLLSLGSVSDQVALRAAGSILVVKPRPGQPARTGGP